MPGSTVYKISRDTVCPIGKWNSDSLFVKYINIKNDKDDRSETSFGVYIYDSFIQVLPEFIYEDNRVFVSGRGKIISYPQLQDGKKLPLNQTVNFKIIKEWNWKKEIERNERFGRIKKNIKNWFNKKKYLDVLNIFKYI